MRTIKNTITIIMFCFSFLSYSQKENKQSILRDSLDNKLDASDFLMQANGFIPVPNLITEPAVGGIGIALATVFIKPNKNQIKGEYVPPDITAGFAAYTGNKSWGIGGIRVASLPKHRLRYRFGLVYANLNMDFYRDLPIIGEQQFSFNFKLTPVFGSIMKEIGRTNLYVGVQYLYLNAKVNPEFKFENFPDFDNNLTSTHNLSSFGIKAEYDKRDNVFTPNKGSYITTNYTFNAPWTGSDYEFQNFTLGVLKYFQTTPNLVSGFRFDTTIQFGDAPFYAKPSIQLRGVPLGRYQGDSTYVLETEQRYDVSLRWSIVAFGGLAKAPSKRVSFKEAMTVYNYGTGFRYLIARKFGLRMGVDIAGSNNDFAYYITFGSAWNARG